MTGDTPHKRTKDVVTRRVFQSPDALGGRAPPGEAKTANIKKALLLVYTLTTRRCAAK